MQSCPAPTRIRSDCSEDRRTRDRAGSAGAAAQRRATEQGRRSSPRPCSRSRRTRMRRSKASRGLRASASGRSTATIRRARRSSKPRTETRSRSSATRPPSSSRQHRPDVALARFLDRFIDHMLTKRGMIEAMRAVIAAGGHAVEPEPRDGQPPPSRPSSKPARPRACCATMSPSTTSSPSRAPSPPRVPRRHDGSRPSSSTGCAIGAPAPKRAEGAKNAKKAARRRGRSRG